MSLPPPLGALEMTLPAGDGLLLKGALAYPELHPEGGYPLAVLAHQYPATSDSYAPLIEDLLELGVATLAFDQRGHGASTAGPAGAVVIDTPLGFTAEAFGAAFVGSASKVGFKRIDDDIFRVAAWGAVQNFIDPSRLMLVGASVGGTGATLAAPRVPGLGALLTFGAAGELVWGSDGREQGRQAMERITARTLHTSSEGDPFSAAANARAWSDGLKYAQALLVPGTAHAMAIYYAVRDEVREFTRGSLL
jgi:pimeloyl-ACP methyl ester carboxylesterase